MFGKLNSIFSTKTVFLTSVVIYKIGSLISGSAVALLRYDRATTVMFFLPVALTCASFVEALGVEWSVKVEKSYSWRVGRGEGECLGIICPKVLSYK